MNTSGVHQFVLSMFVGRFHIDAYLLIGGTVVAGLMNVGFWALAARICAPDVVGVLSSVIGMAGIVAAAGELGIGIGLVRFLPSASTNAPHIVNAAITLVSITTLICALMAVVWTASAGGELGPYLGDAAMAGAFVTASVATAIVALSNSVLLSCHRPTLIGLTLVVLEGLKLLAVATIAECWGALLLVGICGGSAALAAAVTLTRFVPASIPGFRPLPTFAWTELRRMMAYSLANYWARFLIQFPPLVLPLLVLSRIGADSAGYLVPAILVFRAITIIPTSAGNALFAAGSRTPSTATVLARNALPFAVGLAMLATAGAIAVLPPLLQYLGEGYAQQSRNVAMLLAASSIPWGVTYVYMSLERVRRRTSMLLLASTIPTLCSLLGAAGLAGSLGLEGIGLGFLLGQALGALCVGPTLWSLLRQGVVAD